MLIWVWPLVPLMFFIICCKRDWTSRDKQHRNLPAGSLSDQHQSTEDL